ncbi:MAG: aminoglycoside phosphotransferase [Caulobacteraceae bacterium]|nr:aminoglycoside phosphotransferase [Caulobacteraceae bacterium]
MNIDAALARRLVAGQFPEWADLPIAPVTPGGWDNLTLRLGPGLLVRLPSAARYAAQVEKEQFWLPRLAPLLPLPIPAPVAMGEPAEDYPWPWSVYEWLEGEPAETSRIADPVRFADNLAGFLEALHAIDTWEGPPPGAHNFDRGGSLAVYDGETRRAIAALGGRIDVAAATAVWEAALAAPWSGPPVWVHGDFAADNLLVRDGDLSAVIDFGCCAVGDPACDLAIAWTFLEGEAREAFRARLPLDPGVWARARGWTLWKALIVMAQLPGANPHDADASHRIIDDVVAEHARVSRQAT